MRRSTFSEERGVGYIELLVASLIFLFFALGLSEVILTSLKVNQNSDFTTQAATLAMQKLEELRQLAYDDPDLQPTNPGSPQEDPVPGFPEMTRLWTIEEDAPVPGVKRITVTVTAQWGNLGPPRSVTLRTFRTALSYATGLTS